MDKLETDINLAAISLHVATLKTLDEAIERDHVFMSHTSQSPPAPVIVESAEAWNIYAEEANAHAAKVEEAVANLQRNKFQKKTLIKEVLDRLIPFGSWFKVDPHGYVAKKQVEDELRIIYRDTAPESRP